MKLLPMVALVGFFGAPAVAQDAPAGARATGCDIDSYTAVRSDRTGEILYWTNSTCIAPRSGSDASMMDGMMGDSMMDAGMMGSGMMGGMSDMSDDSMMN